MIYRRRDHGKPPKKKMKTFALIVMLKAVD